MKKIALLLSLFVSGGLTSMENSNSKFDLIEEESIEDIFGPQHDLFSDDEFSDAESSPRGIKRERDESPLEVEKSAKQKTMTAEELAAFLQKETNEIDFGLKEKQLLLAAKMGNIGQVRSLVAEGVDVNARDEDGLTSICFAETNGHDNVVSFLLEHGAIPCDDADELDVEHLSLEQLLAMADSLLSDDRKKSSDS